MIRQSCTSSSRRRCRCIRHEENEVDLVKLRNWLAKVRERDVFSADGRHAVEKALGECEQSLEAYAAQVYASETDGR